MKSLSQRLTESLSNLTMKDIKVEDGLVKFVVIRGEGDSNLGLSTRDRCKPAGMMYIFPLVDGRYLTVKGAIEGTSNDENEYYELARSLKSIKREVKEFRYSYASTTGGSDGDKFTIQYYKIDDYDKAYQDFMKAVCANKFYAQKVKWFGATASVSAWWKTVTTRKLI